MQGIAAIVARDTDLASHSAVVVYHRLASKQEIRQAFLITAGRPDLDHDVEIIDVPEYGIKGARCWALYNKGNVRGNERIVSWWCPAEPKLTGVYARRYQRDYGDGYAHLFCRYLVRVGEDVIPNAGIAAGKLPGMIGEYDLSGYGVSPPGYSGYATWSARMGFDYPKNGVFPLTVYYYGVRQPRFNRDQPGTPASIAAHGGTGSGAVRTAGFLVPGRWHCIEQEVRLNTVKNVALKSIASEQEALDNANEDGELRVWLDGVPVYRSRRVAFRGTDRIRIQCIPFVNIYQGGRGDPTTGWGYPQGPEHYDLAAIVAAKAYVGPPRLPVDSSQRPSLEPSFNVGSQPFGASASASGSLGAGYPIASVNNLERTGIGWGNGGGWAGPAGDMASWVELLFADPETVDRVVLISPQDNVAAPMEPTPESIGTQWVNTAFSVDAFFDGAWKTVASASGNKKIACCVGFAPVTTDRVRVRVTESQSQRTSPPGWALIVELEAWTVGDGGPVPNANSTAEKSMPQGPRSISQTAAVAVAGWNDVVPLSFAGIDHGPRGNGIIPFTNSMPWNPLTHTIRIVGADHGEIPWHVDYVDAGNKFTERSRGNGSHGYQHSAINLLTGDIYLLMCTGLQPVTGPGTDMDEVTRKQYTFGPAGIYRYDWMTKDYVKVADVPEAGYLPIGCALAWWEGPIRGGGAQGALALYSGQEGHIYIANTEVTPWRWTTVVHALPGQAGHYHVVSAYSKRHNCLVFGGGNTFQETSPQVLRQVWRLDADLTTKRMPDAPWRCGVYAGMNVVSDARSGNVICLGKGSQLTKQEESGWHPEHWALNPSGAGSWARLPDPPSWVVNPSKAQSILSCDTPHGVVYVQTYARQWRMSLWRSQPTAT